MCGFSVVRKKTCSQTVPFWTSLTPQVMRQKDKLGVFLNMLTDWMHLQPLQLFSASSHTSYTGNQSVFLWMSHVNTIMRAQWCIIDRGYGFTTKKKPVWKWMRSRKPNLRSRAWQEVHVVWCRYKNGWSRCRHDNNLISNIVNTPQCDTVCLAIY